MRTTAAKLEGKRLSRSVQTGVKHTESCVKPEVEVRIRVRLALRMQKAAKQHQKGLIRLHVSCILGHMAFHLGNGGLKPNRNQ